MNPPYSGVEPWLQLARADQLRGKTVVVILKGDTSTVWFHELVRPYAEIRPVRGRLKFAGAVPCPTCKSKGDKTKVFTYPDHPAKCPVCGREVRASPAPFNTIVAVFHGDGSRAGQLGEALGA